MSHPRYEALLEAAVTPYRERDAAGHLLPSSAFMDLPEEVREELADLQERARAIESALSGMSGTVLAVMDRIG